MSTPPMFLRTSGEPDSDRPSLLYIHGLGESSLCFEGLLGSPRLADYHQVAPDLFGYGRSPRPSAEFSLRDHAASLHRLIGELGLEKVLLLGHSMGGVIAAELIPLLGERAAGFLNIEGNVSLADCTYSSQVAAMPLETFLAEGRTGFLDRLRALVREADPAHENPAVLSSYLKSIEMADPRTFYRNSCDLVEVSRAEGMPQQLAAFGIPQLYVYGAPRGTGLHSRTLLQQTGILLCEIGVAGHWPFLDEPDIFVDILLAFIGSMDPEPYASRSLLTTRYH